MSVAKAARTIGLPTHRLRTITLDDQHRLDPAALRATINRDLRAGLRPFCVVSTAGTTSTGAIDPIAEVTAITSQYGMWHHVDGAFGGLGAVHPGLAAHYAGIDQADSLTVDPHKTLSTPIGCGAALVARPDRLRQAFSMKPPTWTAAPTGHGCRTTPSSSPVPPDEPSRCGRYSTSSAETASPPCSIAT